MLELNGGATPALVVHAGRIVDGDSGKRPGNTVIAAGDAISWVGPDPGLPDGAEEHSFPRSSSIVPGLIDAHTHLNFAGDGTSIEHTVAEGEGRLLLRSAANAREALMSGVTTIRENGAYRDTSIRVRDAINASVVDGPRVLASGTPITITGGHCWPLGGEADGVQGVRVAVRQHVKDGADWIKVMASGGGTKNTDPFLPAFTAAELQAIVDEAHALGRPVAAHALNNVAIENVIDAGFDMIIHCNFYGPSGEFEWRPDLATRIAERGMWVNPTLHVSRASIWHLEKQAEHRTLTGAENEYLGQMHRYYEDSCRGLEGLASEGVRLVAGSDAGWRWNRFGQFFHEIEALASAGLGSAGALKAATSDAAEALGLAHVGKLEKGCVADFIVVDGDPLTDLGALGRVIAVFRDGQRLR